MSKLTRLSVVALAAVMAVPAFADRPEKVDGAYYVAFKGGVNASDRAMLRANGAALRDEFPESNAVEVRVANANALNGIANSGRVEYVEEVPMRYALGLSNAQATPSLSNGLYGILTTKSNVVNSAGNNGAGIVVGVADTSLDTQHPDIAGNLIISANCVGGTSTNPCSGSGDFRGRDSETHATHVAGTILGVNNGVGVVGVASAAKLVHTRVLGPNGGSSSDIMRGVRWMVEKQGAKIVNLSLGGGMKSRTEENFYKEMRTKGALVVAATGNDGAGKISCPACYTVNVAVGAVDVNDVVASFSNKGTGIDVTAPGVMVLSSVPDNSGSEASATAGGTEHRAFGFEFGNASPASGVSGTLVNCGIGNPGECGTGNPAGFVAVVARGTLSFADKLTNVKAQGAAAAIIYNNAAGDFTGTLGAAGSWIPAVSVSQAAGQAIVGQIGTSGNVLDIVSDWDHYDGTSMATPHAAGVAALIWASNTAQTADAVETKLKNGCDDKGAAGYDTTYGYGRVNAAKSLGLQ